MKIGSHVSMSGKEMMLGSVKEALSYDANTFMLYTGAPQNTRRKPIEELRIEEAKALMAEREITDFIVHAPYIINLANAVKPETFEIALEALASELVRTEKMGSDILVLHPGSHVGEGVDVGIAKIVEGLNEVLSEKNSVKVALETMAGKGSEVGRNFEELQRIYDSVKYPERLRVCFDTCHVHDAGYDLVNDFSGVMTTFDKVIGKDQIAAFHMNDSKNPCGAGKDRHENFGFGYIGFDAMMQVVNCPDFEDIPKILESPYVPSATKEKVSFAPYKEEIAMIRAGVFDEKMKERLSKNL